MSRVERYAKEKAGRHIRICIDCNSEYVYPAGSTKDLCMRCYIAPKRARLKQQALEYLGQKCVQCGYDRCPKALHFHHLRDKERSISDMIKRAHAWEKIQAELNKCVLLCANCHAEHHAGYVEE